MVVVTDCEADERSRNVSHCKNLRWLNTLLASRTRQGDAKERGAEDSKGSKKCAAVNPHNAQAERPAKAVSLEPVVGPLPWPIFPNLRSVPLFLCVPPHVAKSRILLQPVVDELRQAEIE